MGKVRKIFGGAPKQKKVNPEAERQKAMAAEAAAANAQKIVDRTRQREQAGLLATEDATETVLSGAAPAKPARTTNATVLGGGGR
jgi:hypothetical protein